MTAYEKHFFGSLEARRSRHYWPYLFFCCLDNYYRLLLHCMYFFYFFLAQYPEAAAIEGELIWKGESIEEVIERILTTGSL
jgi:hypothetical protein